jgi:hypothetical protein
MLASYFKSFCQQTGTSGCPQFCSRNCVNSLSKDKRPLLLCSRPRLIVSSNDQLSPSQPARRSSTITCFYVIATCGSTCASDVRFSAGGTFRGSMLDRAVILDRIFVSRGYQGDLSFCLRVLHPLFGWYWKGSWRSNYGPRFIHVRVLLRPGFAA